MTQPTTVSMSAEPTLTDLFVTMPKAVPSWWLGRLLCRMGWHRWRTFTLFFADGRVVTKRECRRRSSCQVHERYSWQRWAR